MFAFGGYSDYKIGKCPSNHDETISLIIIVMSNGLPFSYRCELFILAFVRTCSVIERIIGKTIQ